MTKVNLIDGRFCDPDRTGEEFSPGEDSHYYLNGYDVWVTGTDLQEQLKRFWANSQSDFVQIWIVPLKEGEDYAINFYQPQVEGATLIAETYRTKKARKKAESNR